MLKTNVFKGIVWGTGLLSWTMNVAQASQIPAESEIVLKHSSSSHDGGVDADWVNEIDTQQVIVKQLMHDVAAMIKGGSDQVSASALRKQWEKVYLSYDRLRHHVTHRLRSRLTHHHQLNAELVQKVYQLQDHCPCTSNAWIMRDRLRGKPLCALWSESGPPPLLFSLLLHCYLAMLSSSTLE